MVWVVFAGIFDDRDRTFQMDFDQRIVPVVPIKPREASVMLDPRGHFRRPSMGNRFPGEKETGFRGA